MSVKHAETFIKTLSANDVGATGAHQAGILIPRGTPLIGFFPPLAADEINPRTLVTFEDVHSQKEWAFNYIYYNGALTGHSTRNEYRLTGMTDFFREYAAAPGDKVEFSRSVSGNRYIAYQRTPVFESGDTSMEDPDVIVLSGTWKTRRARRN